ncbi:MAG TPA: TlpA disulfide reductase family protein [Bacteroidales bacterium]|nr:TlpA disulfide reductase family protein [Bacteroidales bacterium]
MKEYLQKRWKTYWTTKGWFSKITDLLFIFLIIGMIIPASRKEISAFMAGLMASSPKTIESDAQQTLTDEVWNWQLIDMKGQVVNLGQFKGQTILLNFWATWCPPCIAEMPDIQALYDGFGDKAVFLLVSDEKTSTVNEFAQKKGYNMPFYQQASTTPPAFSTNSIPTTWIISPEGKIVIRKTGAAKWNSASMQELISSYYKSKTDF